MLRRLLTCALVLALIVGALPLSAAAQTTFMTPGPGGAIYYSNASLTASNTTNAITLCTYTVPYPYVATYNQANASGQQTSGVGTSQPITMVLLGELTSASSPGRFSIGANFGGSTATVHAVNGILPVASLANAPVKLIVNVVPIATNNAVSGIAASSVWVRSEWHMRSSVGAGAQASTTIINSRVLGTTTLTAPQTFVATAQWDAAAAGDRLDFYHCSIKVGL